MSRTTILALLACAIFLAWGGWQLLAASKPGEAATPDPAPAAAAAALGRIEPATRVRKVAPPDFLSNPRLEQLLVAEGATVHEGELLGWFAGRAKALAAQRVAEATVARAEAELARVRAGAKSDELLASVARERRASALAAQAAREAERARQLLAHRVISSSDAESRIAEHEAAAQDAQAAQKEREALAEIRTVDLAVAEAAVLEARAEVARQQAEVAVQEIRAPIAGTVLRITVWPGEAADSKGVLELADLSIMHVVAEIYETDAAALREGQPVEILVPGRTERLHARVQQVGWMVKKKEVLGTDPVADIDSRVVEVRVLLGAEGAQLLARMTNQQVQVIVAPASPRLATE